jgi:hypothetical protein
VELLDQARLETSPLVQLVLVAMLATDDGGIRKIEGADCLLGRELYRRGTE